MKSCPNCHLTNPDSALRCDCGYDFGSGTMQESYLPAKERLPAGETKTEIVMSFWWDAVFLALAIWIFFTSPGWLKVLWVTSSHVRRRSEDLALPQISSAPLAQAD